MDEIVSHDEKCGSHPVGHLLGVSTEGVSRTEVLRGELVLEPDKVFCKPVPVNDHMGYRDHDQGRDRLGDKDKRDHVCEAMKNSRPPALSLLLCHEIGLEDVITNKVSQKCEDEYEFY